MLVAAYAVYLLYTGIAEPCGFEVAGRACCDQPDRMVQFLKEGYSGLYASLLLCTERYNRCVSAGLNCKVEGLVSLDKPVPLGMLVSRDVRAYRRILHGSIKYGINRRITYTTLQYTDNWRIIPYVALYAVYAYKYAYSHVRCTLYLEKTYSYAYSGCQMHTILVYCRLPSQKKPQTTPSCSGCPVVLACLPQARCLMW
jgi:hypothetical protein